MPLSRARAVKPLSLARALTAAAIFASAELAAGLLIGRFFDWGRAETLLFLAFRPWLLIGAAAWAARHSTRSRVIFYALALLLAVTSETLLLLGLGAAEPWSQAGRGLVAGIAVVAVAGFVIGVARRFIGPRAVLPVAVALAAMLVIPGAMRGHDAIILGGSISQPADKPDLLLMTALPIIWGEGGAFDPAARPAASYAALKADYAVRPLDTLTAQTLGPSELLLLAQPRALAPEELVALDAWVRGGGRALIITDPLLRWPSELPLGDIGRPPAIGLLAPILTHWGLALLPPERAGHVVRDVGVRRLAMVAPGRWTATNPDCRLAWDKLLAQCQIGRGEALLLADADLMRDDLWAPGGTGRHQRVADNPFLLADLLDRLMGFQRERAGGRVQWLSPDANRPLALTLALLPILLVAGLALSLRRKRPT